MQILHTKESYLLQSGYGPALFLEKLIPLQRAKLFALMTGIISLIFLFITVILMGKSSASFRTFGGAEIFTSLFLFFGVYGLFLRFLQRNRILTFEEIKIAWTHQAYGKILNFSTARMIDEVGSREDLLLGPLWAYLLREQKFVWIWRRLNIPLEALSQKIQSQYPPAAALSLSDVLKLAWQKALGGNHFEIFREDLLVSIFTLDKIFQAIMFEFEVEEKDLLEAASWQRRRQYDVLIRTKFWSRQNLLNTKGIGKDWSGGYTINLDRVAIDITESVKIHPPPQHLYGRRGEIELLERMLVRSASSGNLVVVGLPGVGRHTLLRALAARLNRGQTLGPLRYRRLLQIDTGAVIAGATSLNEVVERIETLFTEAVLAENIILVVNDFDAFLDSHAEAGRVNATEALLPFLQSGLHLIGITTIEGYQSTIGKNPQLERLISKLELGEPSPKQTQLILEDEVLNIEKQSGLWFTLPALQEIVVLAEKLIQNLPNPEKSLEILEETAVFVATKAGERIVLPEHVQKVVTLRTKIPVEKIAGKEKETLLNLENILHSRIIGQEEAIRQLADALRRARSGIASIKRPIGSFLFLGPTGVGKTETAKALAAVYFGSEQRIIRFDMSEFQEVHSINRLIGDADTKSGGLLTEAVIANPFSLILLDELEKAHPKVLDLFLQVFDEGHLTDARGRQVGFANTMIIATSNAGAELIRELVKGGANLIDSREKLLDHLQRQGIFRPEFLNRFDAVIIFRPLSEEQLTQVATLLLEELNARLAEKDIQIKISPGLALAVARGGFSAEFGARPLRRFIQEHIENYVAKGLLAGNIQRGQLVDFSPETLEQVKK